MMIARYIAAAAFAAPLFAAASLTQMPSRTLDGAPPARAIFRAPALAPAQKIALPAPEAKALAATSEETGGRLRVATVRALPKSARIEAWTAIAGGFVARLTASSPEALGLRARLDLGSLPGPIEVRVQGNGGRIESMSIDPALGAEAWTPWTEGPTQLIELFSPVLPASDSLRLGAVLHFTESPLAKAAPSCTVPTACSTGNGALDAAIAQRKKSVAKMTFVDGGQGYLCTGTLLNTERFPQALFMTANHCISTRTVAASLSTFWFYESLACDGSVENPGTVQVAGGAELVFTNYNVDSTLLKLNATPPVGAVYSAWNKTLLPDDASMVSISHPAGDTSRLALGNITSSDLGIVDYPQRMYGVRFTRGIIAGGSSGSGLFTLSPAGSLEFRGTLFGHTGALSCTNTDQLAFYTRFDIFEPQIDQYVRTAPQAADDAPNRMLDLINAPFNDPQGVDKPLNERTTTLRVDNQRIDYVGDIDVYRFRLSAPAWVSTWTEGAQDTVGSILGATGKIIESNDDWQVGPPYNMGMSLFLGAGTYYVQVGHFEATGTGTYSLRMRADNVRDNYTDLWWNPAESGWGVNVNHQGNTLFATLFTYDASGKDLWLSMSDGTLQPDGSYVGELIRTTGPRFNAAPWNPAQVSRTSVGTMRFAFTTANTGILTYTVNGIPVTKNIERISFAAAPTCTWSASDRSFATNFQDLWWGGASESGWGVNITHQGNILFATLFTYDVDGQPLWLVLSAGRQVGNNPIYSGVLNRTRGPAFNAVPFTPITDADNTPVGTMRFDFTDGNTGTMTYTVNGATVVKSIQRLAFGELKTSCSGS
jgi:lysyl endopeptidase